MKRKFTSSKDGHPRSTVQVTFRLTQTEITLLETYAAMGRAGVENWRDQLYFHGEMWPNRMPNPHDHDNSEAHFSAEYVKAYDEWAGGQA